LTETAADIAPKTANVSVIIVAYGSRDYIPRCLAALQAQTVRPARIILVENGSPEDRRVTPDMIPDGVDFIENSENLGFATANNRAAARADTRWLAFLNPDAFAAPDWLERLLASAERHPDAAFFGSTQYAADHPGVLDGAGDVYHAVGFPYRGGYGRAEKTVPEEGTVFSACAAASLVDRAVFEELGGYDEAYFCYCEDVDLCFRGRLLGYEVIQVPDACVDHVGYASTARYSDFAIYHGTRNRLWTFLKNMPSPLFQLLLPVHAAATFVQLGSAIRRKLLKPFWRGVRDALADWPRISKQRREIQRSRKVGFGAISRALTWNPFKLARRRPDVRRPKP
jgi:GT2 family glycosyltransferase